MAQDNALLNHEWHFSPSRVNFFFLISCDDQTEMVKTYQKGISKHEEVINEYFNEPFHKIREDAEHTTLKRCRCISQPKGHASVRKYSKLTSEGGLLLILRSNQNLIIARIIIKKAVRLTIQALGQLMGEENDLFVLPH